MKSEQMVTLGLREFQGVSFTHVETPEFTGRVIVARANDPNGAGHSAP